MGIEVIISLVAWWNPTCFNVSYFSIVLSMYVRNAFFLIVGGHLFIFFGLLCFLDMNLMWVYLTRI